MQPSFYIKISLLLVLFVGISACGFQLKQEQALDPSLQSIALVHKRLDPGFQKLLEKGLQQRGVRISPLATTRLNILSYQEQRQAASVDTSSARQTETRITKVLKYSLSNQQGTLIIPPSSLRQSREYVNDNRNISGKAGEERILQKSLDREIVRLLLRRLESVQSPLEENASEPTSTPEPQ